jgi:hypothetical protein
MRIGASLLLIAVGAILRFAITPQYSHGVNWGTVGVILMIVGAVGAIFTAVLLTARRRTDVTYRGTPIAGQAGVPVDPRYSSATYVEPGPLDPRI